MEESILVENFHFTWRQGQKQGLKPGSFSVETWTLLNRDLEADVLPRTWEIIISEYFSPTIVYGFKKDLKGFNL